MNELVTYRHSDSISTITMDDGKVNCLSPAMLSAIRSAFEQAETHRAVVVFTGRAGRFSGGFDLGVFERGGEELKAMLRAGAELAERLLTFPYPIAVACNGHALAMGAFLLLCADFRIGTEGPYKIGLNEVAIGLTVPHFGIEIARHKLAPAHFDRALVTSEIYSPQGAVEAGFLDAVVPASRLAAESQEVANRLAALDMTAHAGTKLRTRGRALDSLRAAIREDFGS